MLSLKAFLQIYLFVDDIREQTFEKSFNLPTCSKGGHRPGVFIGHL